MKIKITSSITLGLLLCLLGCSSGTWENDSGNWERAFQTQKPDDVTVLHSKYWRSPHWSYEFEYFFEIEQNDKLKEQLFTQNKLVKLKGKAAEEAKKKSFGESPKWFAPEAVDNYEVWVYKDDTGSNFRVFVEKSTGNLFLTDYQV